MTSELHRLLEPRSIAVVGASARPGSFGERLAIEALRSPGAPTVHLVHPTYPSVQGQPCVASLGDIATPVDLVLLGVPDDALVDQVRLAAERGAGGAVVFGSTLGLADDIRRAGAGMPILGGGCMGFVNVTRGVRALGYLEPPDPTPGSIALVTHSGSVFSALLRTHRRLEYSVAVSSGQELVTTAADVLDYALDLPETRVVGLFLETMRDVPRLRAALARAADSDVPVVALAVGTSTTGERLVAAHSGALAGGDGAWEALLRAYGVHRVRDLDELVDTLELFAVGRRPRGPAAGIATVHDSGGERVLAADVAERLGVPFAPLAADTLARLADVLDPGLAPANPLDVWGTGADSEQLLTTCLTTLASDPAVAVTALAVDLVEEFDGDVSYPQAVLRAHTTTDAPLAVLAPTAAAVHQPTAARLRAAGVPVLEGLTSGLGALGHLLDAVRMTPHRPGDRSAEMPGGGTVVASDSVVDLLPSYGIPVVEARRAASPGQVRDAARAVGWPVALKTAHPEIAHKVDVGGVALDIASEASLDAAYADLALRLGPEVVVQAMAEPGVELALGVTRDPHLGPLVVLAAGGTLVELLSERVVALPPISAQESLRLLDELPVLTRLLDGVRGAEPVDRSAVASALRGISRLALDLDERVAAVDVNPLICTAKGVVAVDALVVAG